MQQKNRFNKMEWAGAFGDIGTFIPFVFGLILLTDIDAKGLFFTFGVALIISGYVYRTPMPIQPMKFITGMAIANPATISLAMISGASVFMGLLWLLFAVTNWVKYITKWITAPIACGISIALGVSFIKTSFGLMGTNWLIALIAIIVAIIFYRSKRFPMMFALLTLGFVVMAITHNNIFELLRVKEMAFTLPTVTMQPFTSVELMAGILVLALPQIPLSIGNAIVAVTRENNIRFQDRPTSERKVTMFQGVMNTISPFLGGISMCHGAGGLVGHARFGAKTGGAVIIIGSIFLAIALLFNQYIEILLLFPFEIVGVILLFTGIDLLLSFKGMGSKQDKIFSIITAVVAIWNMVAAIVLVIILQYLYKKYILAI